MYILFWLFTNDSLSEAASADRSMTASPDAGLPALGALVEYTLDGGLIVVSFLASLIGTWTTVELLHRRTSSGGLKKWQVDLSFVYNTSSIPS